ncbi:MAG TPA: DUF6526 family protein [Flavobacteriaceae bacterium]|nr:DUF6526 family protein [Flavobacteriaceae bacterium]
MNKYGFLKIFELVYLVIFIISTYEVYSTWNSDRNRAYLFLIFAVVSLFMFFFRRKYRQKFQKRKQDNS